MHGMSRETYVTSEMETKLRDAPIPGSMFLSSFRLALTPWYYHGVRAAAGGPLESELDLTRECGSL